MKQPIDDALIAAALERNDGKVYLAARALKIAPKTIYAHIKKNPELQDVIDDARGELIDLAESQLKKALRKGAAWAVCFTLKTVGKERGYSERTELTGPDGGAIRVQAVDYRAGLKAVAPDDDA